MLTSRGRSDSRKNKNLGKEEKMERERGRRVSAARRRAEEHVSGFETTVLRIPEGVGFFDMSVGRHMVDVIPWTVKKGKDEPGGNPMAEKGELYFERTFWTYKKIGVDEKSYVCPSKTFSVKDFIQEYRQKESKNPNADADYLKALAPKERQIFLLFDRKNPDKKIQVLEISYHLFGKLLDSRIKNSPEDRGWDLFYFPDEDGLTLELTVEEVSQGGYKFTEVTAIDFFKRVSPLPAEIVNHNIDPDNMLICLPYEKLKDIFLGVADGKKEEQKPASGNGQTQSHTEPPKQESKPAPKTAAQCGLSPQDEVMYKGGKCTIAKISGDGTSLTLIDANDELHRAVGCEEVQKLITSAPGAPSTAPKQEAPKQEPVAAASTGEKKSDDWDSDW